MKKILASIGLTVVFAGILFAQNIPQASGPKRPDLKCIVFPNNPIKFVQASTSNSIASRLPYPAGITNMLITAVVGSTNASPVSGSIALRFNYAANGSNFSTFNATVLTATLNGTNGVVTFTNPLPIVVNGNGWIEWSSAVVTGTNTVWVTNVFLSYPTGAGQ